MSKNRRRTKFTAQTAYFALAMIVAMNVQHPMAEAQATDCKVTLHQSDFADGTYVIKDPGIYCLGESISFNPNSAAYLQKKYNNPNITAYESGFPLPHQLGFGPGQYDPSAYGLGFFAAIAVASPDVEIDLKGFRIEQSKEHALLMRFFAVIEAADRPFIHGQGPHDFGISAGSAENLTIKNGTIGRSAHHGIHGNSTKNVTIENINFVDFEVAAVSMNGVENLTLRNLTAKSRTDVPVMGRYSTIQFLKPYVNHLVRSRSSTTINGQSVSDIQSRMKAAVNHVHLDLITKNRKTINRKSHSTEWDLFHNAAGVVDGNAYGFLINGVGVAVNGLPTSLSPRAVSRGILIENVRVKRLKANINEVIGVSRGGLSAGPATDPIGSLFQLLAKNPKGQPLTLSTLDPASQGRYVGNIVTDAQALVAKAAHAGEFPFFLNTTRNSISPALVAWVESGTALNTYLAAHPGPHGTGYICNGDQMFHVNKGVIGIGVHGVIDATVENASVDRVINRGKAGSNLCADYQKSHQSATLDGYGGAITRGISIAGSHNVDLSDIKIKRLRSHFGSSIGVDISTDSHNVSLHDIRAEEIRAGAATNSLPTEAPAAAGVRIGVDVSDLNLGEHRIEDLSSQVIKQDVMFLD